MLRGLLVIGTLSYKKRMAGRNPERLYYPFGFGLPGGGPFRLVIAKSNRLRAITAGLAPNLPAS